MSGKVLFGNNESKVVLEKGQEVDFDEILSNVLSRDNIDSTREVSPLKKADDALILDNSKLTREEQLKWALEQVKKVTEKT